MSLNAVEPGEKDCDPRKRTEPGLGSSGAMHTRDSGIHFQINRLEKISSQLAELPNRMKERLSMVLAPRHQPTPPPSPSRVDGSDLANILDMVADRLESALDGCVHIMNEVDL